VSKASERSRNSSYPRLISLALVTLRRPLPTNNVVRLLGIIYRDNNSQFVI
jgi:hypothetical protein